MSNSETEKTVYRISTISILLNFFLAVIKLTGGLIGNSYAVLSDAANSASDVFYSLIVIIGVKVSMKKADSSHQFGHERFECVAAILLSFVLFLTGAGIGYTGISNIVTGAYKEFDPPTVLALTVTCISVVVKLIMFLYTFKAAKRINSSALKADAFNHASDVLSSLAVIIGIVGAMCGLLIFDSIASILVSLLIIKAAIQVFAESVRKMTDQSCDEKTERELRECLLSDEGVMRVDALMTRLFGNRIYVIAEIACNKDLSLTQAHEIAERVHRKVEDNFPLVKHVSVHVNPYFDNGGATQDSTVENIDEHSQGK